MFSSWLAVVVMIRSWFCSDSSSKNPSSEMSLLMTIAPGKRSARALLLAVSL